jgi:hypothetical protein
VTGRGAVKPTFSARGETDKWFSRSAAATVAGLVGIAAAVSLSHIRQLARAHAHAFPVSVDGIEMVASLVLLPTSVPGVPTA